MKHKSLILILIVVFCLTLSLNYVWAAGSATLSWIEGREPDLAGYKIYYGTLPRTGNCPPGGYSKSVNVGNVMTYTFNDLSDGQTYYFSLTAYDIYDNESCFSKEISKVIPKAKFSWYEAISRFFKEIFTPLRLPLLRAF